MLIRKLLIIPVLLCAALHLQAQEPKALSNLRTRKIPAQGTVVLDSLSIIPQSVRLPGIPPAAYRIDEINARLTWLQQLPTDSVSITYRVFSFRLNKPVSGFSYDSIKNNFITRPIGRNRFDDANPIGFDFGQVNYAGSFGRGIAFGNNQDAVLNSSLNLQINGMIGDSMMLAAAITDNNIPIQAEGNTQQLNEFDRVWIQLKKRGWELNLGDIDIRRTDAYFLNFFKRLQGISYQQENQLSSKASNQLLVSGAVAKGKFTRNVFQGLEGNQGPYRLQGANGEQFFIVLAGTERVFIDGEPMVRGEDRDYVINYNTAEITFTPRRMINKDRRIQVEFEYADRNFLNAQIFAGNELQLNERLRLRVNAFSNADSRNTAINQVLDSKQKQFLADIGDGIANAFYPTAVRDSFATNKILYRLVDSTANGIRYDSVFVFSTDAAQALYSVAFTDVGAGNGDYLAEAAGANGRTFRWVAPLNGLRQGRFAPVTQLVAPRTQQMISIGADHQLSQNTKLSTEIAVSRFDVNTLSARDKSNDAGWAGRLQLTHEDAIGPKQKNGYRYRGNLSVEYVADRFRALERLRPVEFTREWGLPIFLQQEREIIAQGGVELISPTQNKIGYDLQHYRRGNLFSGMRHRFQQSLQHRGWQWNALVNYAGIDSGFNRGFFLRPQLDLKKRLEKLGKMELGAQYYLENNRQRYRLTDTLTRMSFEWDTWTLYLRSPEAANRWGFNFFTRRDKLPFGKNMEQTDRSFNYNAYYEWMSNEKHQLRINATLRNLQVYNTQLSGLQPEKTLLGRAEYNISEWKGMLVGSLLYETGSGQEQRRDFSFLEVPAGQGEFTWRDYNDDGIPQLNEFEIAQFRDQARYIRIFTPTLDFIRAGYAQFNYSIQLNPRSLIQSSDASAFAKLLARFSAQSGLQINKKETAGKGLLTQPFSRPASDTGLILLNAVFNNTLFYNRTSTVWGFDLTHLASTNRSILTYGLETRSLRDVSHRLRWNINKHFLSQWQTKWVRNTLTTPGFANRNFALQQWSLEPNLSYQEGTKYRLSLAYKYEEKQNREGEGERSLNHALTAEGRYNVLSSSTVNARFQINSMRFTGGSLNSTVAYIMLDALLPGTNFLWNVDVTRRLSGNIELSFQYDGRKPGSGRTIHSGRASLRALF